MSRASHWDGAYASRGADGVSWHQPVPAVSLELIEALRVRPDDAVLDVGGGGSTLARELVTRGFTDVTVIDVSVEALAATGGPLPADAPVRCVHADLLEWEPVRRYDLWHDRAMFHFLLADGERRRYLDVLRSGTAVGAAVVLGTFAPDAPAMCSGLPVTRYSAAELAAVLGLEPIETRREEHVTPSGAVQPFTWVAGRVASAPA